MSGGTSILWSRFSRRSSPENCRGRRIDADEKEIEALFFDATEQPIQRPSSKKPRREYYSVKQKEHTIKHQIAIGETGKIRAVSPSYPGSVHDKRVHDIEQVVIPRETESRQSYLRVERVGKQKRKPHFPDNWTQTLESGKEASHA